jgi:hypothetical protein
MGRHFKNQLPAAYKLWALFRDGGTVNLKSRDWNGKRYDPEAGLRKLEQYLQQHADQIAQGRIYDKRVCPDRLVRRFEGGVFIPLDSPANPNPKHTL